MSKRIMWNRLALDGYFEGAKRWELDWHEYVWGEELVKENAAASVRALKQQGDRNMFVFGAADLSQTLMNDKPFD